MSDIQSTYNKIATSFSHTRGAPWKEFEIFVKYLKPKDVILDLGCGNGRLYDFLSKNTGVDYTGIDVSENLLAEAKKKFPQGRFLFGDMRRIFSFQDAQFGHLWAIASFHHLKDKYERNFCLEEVKRVLKKDGCFVVMVWNLFQRKYLWLLIKGFIFWFIGKSKNWNDVMVPWKGDSKGKGKVMRYYHAFYPQEIRKLLKKFGFEIVEEFYSRKGEKVSFWKSFNLCFVCKKL